MTKDEMLKEIANVLDRFVKWYNHGVDQRFPMRPYTDRMQFNMWLDCNYPDVLKRYGMDILYRNLCNCCSSYGPSDAEMSAWID